MQARIIAPALAGLIALAACPPSRADVVISLGGPVVSGTTASLGVYFEFAGSPGDAIEAFQLSLLGSDLLLTAGGTDFSRFSFAPNAALFADWSASPGSIGAAGFSLFAPNDLIAGPFLAPSAAPYLIGTLTVDLSGLAAGLVTVTLAGNDPTFPTEALGQAGGSFGPVAATFAQPDGVEIPIAAATVPEPSAWALAAAGVASLLGYRRWRPMKRPAMAA